MGVFEYGRCMLAQYSGHVPVYRTAILLLSLPENANIASMDFLFISINGGTMAFRCYVMLMEKKRLCTYTGIFYQTHKDQLHTNDIQYICIGSSFIIGCMNASTAQGNV